MTIQHVFTYDANADEIADEFCKHDSAYEAEVFNSIGLMFYIWSMDKTKTASYMQILEIAEQLNDNGKRFIKTLCDYIDGDIEKFKSRKEQREVTEAMNAVLLPLLEHFDAETAIKIKRGLYLLSKIDIEPQEGNDKE